MSDQTDHRQHVRRVVLPSGKTIDVVYFEGGPPAAPEDLHCCTGCDGTLVYPIEWAEASATHWEVTLRCPDCECTQTGTFEQALVDRFDDELDRGTEALVRDLKRLMQANMEDEIERFVNALQQDHILPTDF